MIERTHHIKIDSTTYMDGDRNTIGGVPILQKGQSVPCCQKCGRQLTLFLQFDIDKTFNLPFEEGSHFLLFSCIPCENLPDEEYSDVDKVVKVSFGNPVCGHYSLMMNEPNSDEIFGSNDNEIEPKQIVFNEVNKSIKDCQYVGKTGDDFEFKVGGVAAWCNYSINLNCRCGAPISFLCQISDSFDFFAPANKSTIYHSLFFGNIVYVMGRTKQCSPYSLLVACDN
jgi:hypothetical protein